MALWLCKIEPDCYSFDALVRDGETLWDGVSNALARKHLRQMKPGDRGMAPSDDEGMKPPLGKDRMGSDKMAP